MSKLAGLKGMERELLFIVWDVEIFSIADTLPPSHLMVLYRLLQFWGEGFS